MLVNSSVRRNHPRSRPLGRRVPPILPWGEHATPHPARGPGLRPGPRHVSGRSPTTVEAHRDRAGFPPAGALTCRVVPCPLFGHAVAQLTKRVSELPVERPVRVHRRTVPGNADRYHGGVVFRGHRARAGTTFPTAGKAVPAVREGPGWLISRGLRRPPGRKCGGRRFRRGPVWVAGRCRSFQPPRPASESDGPRLRPGSRHLSDQHVACALPRSPGPGAGSSDDGRVVVTAG